MDDDGHFPRFRAHPLLRGGHLQTLGGLYLPGKLRAYRAARHSIVLDDQDTIVVHDDRPPGWKERDGAALLLHGLAGCHLSPYMIRVAGKLNDIGLRTFRMDHRGCGAGSKLARLPYHAGRSDDARRVLGWIASQCPNSPLSLIGFSLSGNIVLKTVGENPGDVPKNLKTAVAVNPPVDLSRCVHSLERPACRPYDRHFVKLLHQQVRQRQQTFPDAPTAEYHDRPATLFLFDDQYTALVSGFDSAEDYYARCSSTAWLSRIQIPTLILAARDDPLIPVSVFESLQPSRTTRLHIAESGGHLGYVGRRGVDRDRRWMDWRIVDWIGRHYDNPTTPKSL